MNKVSQISPGWSVPNDNRREGFSKHTHQQKQKKKKEICFEPASSPSTMDDDKGQHVDIYI